MLTLIYLSEMFVRSNDVVNNVDLSHSDYNQPTREFYKLLKSFIMAL
ncbi:MAG: hypothetical protein LBQ13_02785 [Endomicrobium sp.]|nr:hypothetical protein [Endomicrobium sp.]